MDISCCVQLELLFLKSLVLDIVARFWMLDAGPSPLPHLSGPLATGRARVAPADVAPGTGNAKLHLKMQLSDAIFMFYWDAV